MTLRYAVPQVCLWAAIICVLSAPLVPVARGEVLDKTMNAGGIVLHYKVVLPNGYDPGNAYPAVFAFPPGSQSMNLVNEVLANNYEDQAEKRGYILVIPAAPDGELFFEDGQRVFPAFLEVLLRDYKIQDNKFHAVGNSNGDLSAFYIAALYPRYFLSVTGFPGYLPFVEPASVQALALMCINMYVGGLDSDWLASMQRQAEQLRKSGLRVRFAVEAGQPHVIGTLKGDGAARLFDGFEEARQGCRR